METAVLGLRVALSLAAVLGLIWFAGRRLQGTTGARRQRSIPMTMLGRQSLGKNANIALVEVGGQVLLLGVGDQGVRVLTEVDVPAAEPSPASAASAPSLASAAPSHRGRPDVDVQTSQRARPDVEDELTAGWTMPPRLAAPAASADRAPEQPQPRSELHGEPELHAEADPPGHPQAPDAAEEWEVREEIDLSLLAAVGTPAPVAALAPAAPTAALTAGAGTTGSHPQADAQLTPQPQVDAELTPQPRLGAARWREVREDIDLSLLLAAGAPAVARNRPTDEAADRDNRLPGVHDRFPAAGTAVRNGAVPAGAPAVPSHPLPSPHSSSSPRRVPDPHARRRHAPGDVDVGPRPEMGPLHGSALSPDTWRRAVDVMQRRRAGR